MEEDSLLRLILPNWNMAEDSLIVEDWAHDCFYCSLVQGMLSHLLLQAVQSSCFLWAHLHKAHIDLRIYRLKLSGRGLVCLKACWAPPANLA